MISNCEWNDDKLYMDATYKFSIISNLNKLTHRCRVTHICVSNLTIIGSDNGLSPGRRQAIIWTNDGILLVGPLGTNFSELLIEIQTFSSKKKHLKVSSVKFCLGLNKLMPTWSIKTYHTEMQLKPNVYQPNIVITWNNRDFFVN